MKRHIHTQNHLENVDLEAKRHLKFRERDLRTTPRLPTIQCPKIGTLQTAEILRIVPAHRVRSASSATFKLSFYSNPLLLLGNHSYYLVTIVQARLPW